MRILPTDNTKRSVLVGGIYYILNCAAWKIKNYACN